MASIFTYQEEPPRVHSPWSTPGAGTPQRVIPLASLQNAPDGIYTTSMTKLEPERQDGPTEYKLHLLLRPRGSTPVTSILAKESRQARLQQLTTQLLWRLQQSSPFHSSSNAELVLPILPDATPRLGIPDKAARLLPGLEESQGALYEIGVADDGTLVGLIEEELEESLTNLRAMAASLGCVVDVLRRVVVSQSGENEIIPSTTVRLWVAEVLVRPDTDSPKLPPLEVLTLSTLVPDLKNGNGSTTPAEKASTEQVRIALVGASTAGKSSLVGTLTSSTLDNGRGKSRLALLKHRHEIASGVTSSVAQELIGYRGDDGQEATVINYSSGDVSSWPDIHDLSHRLVFLSDSPGLPRYAKSMFRTLISWDPHWTLLCISADEVNLESLQVRTPDANVAPYLGTETISGSAPESIDVSLAHLDMCLKLDKRLVIVVTKMDLATKTGLRSTLSRILSALKQAGKAPMLLGAPSGSANNTEENVDVARQLCQLTQAEQDQLSVSLQSIKEDQLNKLVPIVLTSAVTGIGFGKLHKLLKDLPVLSGHESTADSVQLCEGSTFHVDEIFAIPPSRVYSVSKKDHSADQGSVLCGHLKAGKLSVGDHMRLGPFWLDHDTPGDSNNGLVRSASYSAGSIGRPLLLPLPGELSKSLQGEKIRISGHSAESTTAFIDVKVVSVRSLRLSVRSMHEGETGTVGVQPLDQPSMVPLSRARKGMILTSRAADELAGYRSFAAAFSSTQFSSMDSAPLILGGHAIIYINSIRAAAKVIAVRLDEDGNREPSSPTELFSFDHENDCDNSASHQAEIRITFRFVSSVERVEPGDKVLVIPTTTAAGPASGPPATTVNGLSGFIGRIVEIST